MIIRARVLLPISGPPLEDGAIHVSENRISAVGRWRDLKSVSEQVFDLGDSIILPGLINAHCHLDYTNMAGMIAPPKSFSDWIKALLAIKAAWSYSEYSASWLNGASMLLRTGTTTVADIEAVPELLPEVWGATPLRICSLLELIHVKSTHSAKSILAEAAKKIDSLKSDRCSAGLSPHALYSTSPELLKSSAKMSHQKSWLLSTHLAESREELDMFAHRRGGMFDWLKTQRDMSDCRGVSPVEQLDQLGMLSPKFLAVHANYISESDATLLAKRGCSVVHCPRSHAYFGHKKFPQKTLTNAGVNLCLGTDSLASVAIKSKEPAQLNMFFEMQSLAKVDPDIPPEKILSMATTNGARALGLPKRIGQLSPGAFADLIAVPFPGKISTAYEAVLRHEGEVSASMIHGEWKLKS